MNKKLKTALFVYTLIISFVAIGISISLVNSDAGKSVEAAGLGEVCDLASDCHGIPCAYPLNSYCNIENPSAPAGRGICECVQWDQQAINGCNGVFSPTEPPACPAGWSDCGTSYTNNSSATPDGCQVMGEIMTECASCGNTSVIYRFCRQNQTPPPPPQEPQPFCGDAVCDQGEACERTNEGSNTYRECTTVGQAPTGDPVANCRRIQNGPGDNNHPNSCTFCGDGVRQNNEECDYAVDENCNLNCTMEQLEEGIRIDKTVLEDRVYEVGEQVRFNVRITNTGESTFNVVRFRDNWDPTYLSYIGGSVRKSTGETISDVNTILTSRTNNQIRIIDVTEHLGDLAPNQFYEFTLVFTAVAPTPNYNPVTCNNAFVRPDDLPENSDNDCVPIDNRDTDV